MKGLWSWIAANQFETALLVALVAGLMLFGWVYREGKATGGLQVEATVAKAENKALRRNIATREEMNEIRNNRPDGAGVADCLRRSGCF